LTGVLLRPALEPVAFFRGSEFVRCCVVLAIALACACSAADATVAVRSPSASPAPNLDHSAAAAWTADPNIAFRARSGTPPGAEACGTNADVESLLREFAAAFNSGDASRLSPVISTEFWAISLGHLTAYSRDDALRMLTERHRVGDRLEFVGAQVNGLVGWDGAAHIGPVDFTLIRGEERIRLSGKGALFCGGTTRGVKVMGLGIL